MEYLHMDLLPGTLDMLVLRTLRTDRLHGYRIAKNIRSTSNYPALKRLEAKGWIASAWEISEHVKEFGIRFALGASRRDVVWLVERRGLILAGMGIVIGVGSPPWQCPCSPRFWDSAHRRLPCTLSFPWRY
jgi:hypothetical protein